MPKPLKPTQSRIILPRGGRDMHGIKKLTSGRWQARYFAGFDRNGKRIYPSKSFLLQSDAIRWRRDRIHEKESGRPVDSLELTVGAYLDQWIEMKRPKVGGNTIKGYVNISRIYIRPTFESRRLRSITPMDIHLWQQSLLERVGACTVNNARRAFNNALKQAVDLYLIPRNPISSIDAPRQENAEMKTFNLEQSQRFAAECGMDRWGVFYLTMLMAGLRPEEAQALQWSLVDLAAGRIKVQKSIFVERQNKWNFQSPKTGKSKREIVVHGWLIERLAEHRKRQLTERLKAGSAYENNDLVFCNAIGQPLLINALEVNFKKRVAAMELPRIRLYDLRHTFCTLSLAAGIDVKTVSANMGHSSVAFTLDHYGHVLESMREGAAKRMEEFFGNPSARGAGK